MKLSIVFGTLNRLSYLKDALTSIPGAVGNLEYEIVVVDGGSADGSIEYLRARSAEDEHLRVIEQGERKGAVSAFNKGFHEAKGRYVAAFNDDAIYVGNPLEQACTILDERDDVGQVAIPFSIDNRPPKAEVVNLWRLRLTYANFGVIRRKLGEQLGWWGDNRFQYGGDTELSIKVWNANYKVVPLVGEGHIVHYAAHDDTRVPNIESRMIGAKWNNAPMPDVIRAMFKTHPQLPTQRQHVRPVARYEPRKPKIPKPGRLAGSEGMVLVRYIGERGLQALHPPSGTEYRFSTGASLYVAAGDLEYVFEQQRPGDELKVIR